MIVGFDRKIRAGWLDATARFAAEGLSPAVIREQLDDVLDGQVSGKGPHSARGKTMTVLCRVWVTVPDRVVPLRDDALSVLDGGRVPDLRPLHWGMCLTSYPFFRDVAAITGRLLSLQGSVTLAMVTRRIVEGWGARSTVLRASQRVVRSMVDWGALVETERRGLFRSGPTITVQQGGPRAGWLLEAALLASGRQSMRFGTLVRHPMLFPFGRVATVRDAEAQPRLELFREGAGEDVVGLRHWSPVRR